MIYKEDIALSITRSWKRKDTGEDFYDTSKSGNILDYIFRGTEEGSWTDEKEENFVFTDTSVVKNHQEMKGLSEYAAEHGGGFKAGGVITVKGEEGYRRLKNINQGREIMRIILLEIARFASIPVKCICYFAGIHKNTMDRHIHFLFFSEEKERNKVRIKELTESIKKKIEEKEIRGKREDFYGYEMRRTGFLSGTMDVARNISRAGIKMRSISSLPLILREEIRAYAEDLIKMTDTNRELDRKIKEKIALDLKAGTANKALISEYFSEEFYSSSERDVFYLIKSTALAVSKTAVSTLDPGIKKKTLKSFIKTHAKMADEIIKRNASLYYEKLSGYLSRLIQPLSTSVKEEGNLHIGNVSPK